MSLLRKLAQVMFERGVEDSIDNLLALLPNDPSAALLDLGCGDGKWTVTVGRMKWFVKQKIQNKDSTQRTLHDIWRTDCIRDCAIFWLVLKGAICILRDVTNDRAIPVPIAVCTSCCDGNELQLNYPLARGTSRLQLVARYSCANAKL